MQSGAVSEAYEPQNRFHLGELTILSCFFSRFREGLLPAIDVAFWVPSNARLAPTDADPGCAIVDRQPETIEPVRRE